MPIRLLVLCALLAVACKRSPDDGARLRDAEGDNVAPPATPLEACPDADAGALIDGALAKVGSGAKLSTLIPQLFSEGVTLDAVQSSSAQSSDGEADPRLLVKVGCLFHTFTLNGKSLELGVTGQTADVRLPKDGQKNPDSVDPAALAQLAGELEPTTHGEILVDVHEVEAGAGEAADVTSHIPKGATKPGDSNACSRCHTRVRSPVRQLGQKVVRSRTGDFLAIVVPYGREGNGGWCVPKDLELIQACKCVDGERPAKCDKVGGELGGEACARLKAVLDLKPTQLGWVAPDPGKCLAD